MKRLFIAVGLDSPVRDQLSRLSSVLREHLGPQVTASWVPADRMHLTLSFFGSADAGLERQIRRVFDRPFAQPAFSLSFAGIAMFPPSGAPRVLWLDVRDGSTSLRQLHDELIGRLRRESMVQAEHEGERFTPHLTLARFRDRVARAAVAGLADISAAAGPCRIDRVTLYESRLSPSGPAYLPLADALLGLAT